MCVVCLAVKSGYSWHSPTAQRISVSELALPSSLPTLSLQEIDTFCDCFLFAAVDRRGRESWMSEFATGGSAVVAFGAREGLAIYSELHDYYIPTTATLDEVPRIGIRD